MNIESKTNTTPISTIEHLLEFEGDFYLNPTHYRNIVGAL